MPKGGRALRGIFKEMLDPLFRVAKKGGAEGAGDAASATGKAVAKGADDAAMKPLKGLPSEKTLSKDYPFLRKSNQQLEADALPGKAPTPEPKVHDASGRPLTPDANGDYDLPGYPKLPDGQSKTFTGDVTPYDWPAGQTRYRVVGDEQFPAGSFWSEHPPTSNRELRSDLAVLNDWNGDHGYVAYTPSETIRGWHGPTAAQQATGPIPGTTTPTAYLPGGGNQIWIDRTTIPDLDDSSRWLIGPTSF